MSPGGVVLCEPQCWGFEHVLVNSALLDTVLIAYPEEGSIFLGEDCHVETVRGTLAHFDQGSTQRVEWDEIKIPPRARGGVLRLPYEWGWCRTALRVARRRRARALILCSITNTGLLVLKCCLALSRGTEMSVLVIPHSILSTISDRQPRAPWNKLLSLRSALRIPEDRSLQYVVLGDSILRCLQEVVPDDARHFKSLDHPYFMQGYSPDGLTLPDKVRFGFLGADSAEKGFDRFARLAEEVRSSKCEVEFVMAGFLTKERAGLPSGSIEGMGYDPLSRSEYARRVTSLTYVIGVSDPEHYMFTASGAFMDALAFAKPGIYLRNPFLEYYFERLGDIGYICNSEQELRDVVVSIAREFPAARYLEQQRNIVAGRDLFEPRKLAPRLRSIIDRTCT